MCCGQAAVDGVGVDASSSSWKNKSKSNSIPQLVAQLLIFPGQYDPGCVAAGGNGQSATCLCHVTGCEAGCRLKYVGLRYSASHCPVGCPPSLVSDAMSLKSTWKTKSYSWAG